MRMSVRMAAAAIGLTLGALAANENRGLAQQPSASQPTAPSQQVRMENLPAPVRLGLRVEGLRRRLGVVPMVIIVPDTASYIAAISGWNIAPRPNDPQTFGLRYPVLIDDGTWRARENIARFVRAFAPAKTLRWRVPDGAPLPPDANAIREAVERSTATAWGVNSSDELKALWVKEMYSPPGVVAVSASDPAWPAALALAAGRGQIFAWVSAPGTLVGSMSAEHAKKLNSDIEAACAAGGYQWKDTGDQIDAVTLCLNIPASVRPAEGDPKNLLATTDVIGRDGEDLGKRWAWAGQIIGNEARAAYSAMCALFLQPERAWCFDGYENSGPKADWDATPAAALLEKAKISTLLNDVGDQAAVSWRARAGGMGLPTNTDANREPAAGVNAGFIAVNSSGFPEYFDLSPGQCRASDVPFLHVPAAVHFVHSYSAAHPGDRVTIAARFFERGAFAYVGAVHEPYLDAFVRTAAMTERMLGMGPWGASVRLDNGKVWKVAVFGDPLWTIGPKAPRIDAPLPLAGAQDVQELLSAALKEKRYADGLAMLVMQGRDADAASLVRLIQKDDPAAMTPDVALAGVMPVFRSPGREGAAGSGERLALLTTLCTMLEPKYAEEPELRDVLWHAAFPSFGRLTEAQVKALGAAIRPEHIDRDAGDLAAAAARSLGRDRAGDLMRTIVPTLKSATAQQAVDRALRQESPR